MNERIEPEIGMGATYSLGSDKYPFTIVAVSPSKRTIFVTEDTAKLVSGTEQDGSAKYEYTARMDVPQEVFTLRKNGRYHRKGDSTKGGCMTVGHRRRYNDPHF